MKFKIIIFIIIISLFLIGCTPLVYDTDKFIMPDDRKFIMTVESLDTPEKIAKYIEDNFEYCMFERLRVTSPYNLWKTKKGVCGNFATFAKYVADYHGYEAYLVIIYFKNTLTTHAITVFKIDDRYSFISNHEYFLLNTETIEQIVNFYGFYDCRYTISGFEVY